MTQTQPADRAAVTAAYESVRATVEKTAKRFAKRFQYDEEDILGDANVIFLSEAYPGYRPELGNFERRVLSVVWNRLYDRYRVWCRHDLRAPIRSNRDASLSRQSGRRAADGYDAEDYYDVLGRDARAVVRLLLSPVPGLDETLRALPSGTAKRRQVKLVLQKYLTETRGWDRQRVRRAFAEIGEVVS